MYVDEDEYVHRLTWPPELTRVLPSVVQVIGAQTVPWASEPPEYHPQVVVNFEVEDREVTEEATCRP